MYMGRTRTSDKKVRVTIRIYESTLKMIKENGSSPQKEWDKLVENMTNPEKNGEDCKKGSD